MAPSGAYQGNDDILQGNVSRRRLQLCGNPRLPQWTDWLLALLSQSSQFSSYLISTYIKNLAKATGINAS